MNYDLKKIKYFGKLNEFRDYFELTENNLEEVKKNNAANIRRAYNLTDPDEFQECEGLIQIDNYLHENTITNLFRSSFIIAFCSFVEMWFVWFLQEAKSQSILTRELPKKDSLDESVKYLENELKLGLLAEPEWKDLKDFQLIRNCIVHADSVIDRMQKDRRNEKLWTLVRIKPNIGVWVNSPLAGILKLEYEENLETLFSEHRKTAKIIILQDYCRFIMNIAERFFEKAVARTGVNQ